MPFRCLPLFLLAAACTDADWQALKGAPDDVIATPTAGIYAGQLDLQVRAYGGPLKVAERSCVVDFEVEVHPQRTQWFLGRSAPCELGDKVGTYALTLPSREGALFQGATGGPLEGLDGDWAGWFHGDDLLYAESAGESASGPGQLAYVLTVDAVRVASIE